MYELGHVLLLFWGRQVGVVGSQGVKDRPAVAAQFLAILRTIFPKLAVPLRKKADQGSIQSPLSRSLQSPPFSLPSWRDISLAADPTHMWLKA